MISYVKKTCLALFVLGLLVSPLKTLFYLQGTLLVILVSYMNSWFAKAAIFQSVIVMSTAILLDMYFGNMIFQITLVLMIIRPTGTMTLIHNILKAIVTIAVMAVVFKFGQMSA